MAIPQGDIRLAYLMQQFKMSVSELSRRSGVSRKTLDRFLAQGNVMESSLVKIAAVFGLTISQIRGEEIPLDKLALMSKLSEEGLKIALYLSSLPRDDWRRKAIEKLIEEEAQGERGKKLLK